MNLFNATQFVAPSLDRTAGCGPACPVVWEGGVKASPYPDRHYWQKKFAQNRQFSIEDLLL